MSEMIERVARAAEQAEEEWLRREGDAEDGLQEHNTVPLRIAVARAAVEAMRVPTDKMISELCCCSLSWDSQDTTYIEPADALDAWQDAIDEALK